MGQKKRLGFLGGTFNPIHDGHLRLACESRIQFDLDPVLFIPNHIPPHRSLTESGIIDGEKRYFMTILATLSNPHFYVSDIELKRGEVSYTYDTAVQLKKEFPNTQINFICGIDTLIRHKWHRLQELMELLDGVIVAPRGNETLTTLLEKNSSLLPYAKKFKELKMETISTSSSEIRNRIRSGKNIQSMVPSLVEEYIKKYKLYEEVYSVERT